METICVGKEFSSSAKINMDKEFVFYNYKYIQKENSPVYGAADSSEVVIRPVYFDELCYLLNADGAHLILFGGTWSEKTQAVIDRVNFFARKYGVDTVYNFDFRVDGESEHASFKADLTEQASYDGPGKREPIGCAECNYLYGEIVTRHFTNLNDWVRKKVGEGDDITYLNLYVDAVTVPRLEEPFLVLYNKDNKVDHSGNGGKAGSYPIVGAMELDYTRDEIPEDLDAQLECCVFGFIGKDGNDIIPYTHQDYMYDSFRQNQRGHSFKTEDCFKKGEQINITPVTLQELRWILSQKGSFLVLFAGAWCANSQAGIATVNDFAVANDVTVYMLDSRIEGKYQIDFWKYPRQNELKLSHPAVRAGYLDLWERCLPGAPVLCSVNPNSPFGRFDPTVLDDAGGAHTVLPIDIPYFLAVNKDNPAPREGFKPVLAACNHDGFELINCVKTFIYHKPNYRKYTAGIYFVMNAYCDSLGTEPKDIGIDRTAPVVEGEVMKNPDIKGEVKYFKEHDWYKERGGAGDCGCC